jgi:hypothetical protein
MENAVFGGIIIIIVLYSIIKGISSGRAEAKARFEYDKELKQEEFKYRKVLQEKLSQMLGDKPNAFSSGNIKGRKWFSELVAEAHAVLDQYDVDHLNYKNRPAYKAAETVAEFRGKNKELRKQLKYYEYQIKTYEEFFPILEDVGDQILDDDSFLNAGAGQEGVEKLDPIIRFIPKEEFDRLPESERNQRALDNYKNKNHNNLGIGRFYERYIGFLYEEKGWTVKFHGVIEGYEDLGRDLICTKDKRVEIVQAKNWSKSKVIREKHLFQLYGTVIQYKVVNKDVIKQKKLKITPAFITTTELSETAQAVADDLNIRVSKIELDKNYPMIKCNINKVTSEKIYHLPMDQQYDKILIGDEEGECYVATTSEAENKGFRRAWKYRGSSE